MISSPKGEIVMPNPEITRVCVFCESATVLADGESVVCESKGVVCADHVCRKFKYDPLKRVPEPMAQLPHLELPPEE